jgi:hypothetical protein
MRRSATRADRAETHDGDRAGATVVNNRRKYAARSVDFRYGPRRINRD